MVEIVGITGSLRSDSYSALALEQALKRVKALDAEVGNARSKRNDVTLWRWR